MRKFKKIAVAIIPITVILILIVISFAKNSEVVLRKDFKQNRDVFENVIAMFEIDEYKKFSAKTYAGNDKDLNYLFKNLKYTEVYSDYFGNVFFNKFAEGINFNGLVYLNDKSYVVGIIKTKSVFIDSAERWIIHRFHGL